MSTFSYTIRLARVEGESSRSVEALVDTGATYSVIPSNLLRELNISPRWTACFELADGRMVPMGVGEAWITINGESTITRVIFGENDITPLLGSYALEGLLLAVDSYNERLFPVDGLLKRSCCPSPVQQVAHGLRGGDGGPLL